MDSSDHEQCGLKMEGVDFGYRKVRCLNSQNLFDDKGLCYGFDLRKGNTYSGKGAVEMMENAFRVIPRSIQKFFVADSAYGNLTVYNCLVNHNVNFAICLKENVWEPQLEKCKNKITWHKSKLYFFGSDKCEIGSAIYSLKGLVKGRTFLRVVFIRTKKKEIKAGDNHPYHYYAIVTNMSESEMTNEQVIKFYRRRSQVENNIKDLKQGMDFYHFPCQSLKANNVWGLMGIIAYNMMRMVSFTISEDGCYVNTTRRKLVLLAGEVIKHARSIEIRMMDYIAREVTRLKMILCRLSFLDREDRLIPLRP
ncbi:MAG: transposase, partial [Bdellovibrionales bacterium]|nr:transposase [Bdellovibrionales bacterium]